METDQDKRAIRAEYRRLGEEIAAAQDEMMKPGSDSIVKMIGKGNELLPKVKTAVEGAEDSRFMVQLAFVGRKKIQELKTESHHFSPSEFADKLQVYALHGQELPLTKEHWAALGKAAQSFFRHPPTFECLLGSFAKQPLQKPERVKKPRMKDDNSKDKSTKVKEIVDRDEQLESTASDVSKRVLPALLKLYKHNTKEPIDYFEFVVDPDSFGATVENMFHVSFLIRDGLAEIKLDEEGLPVIRPTIGGLGDSLEGRERELENKPRKQALNQLTIQQWKDLKRVFHIKKARIPPRESQAVSSGCVKS